MRRIYVASSWRNPFQQEVVGVLRNAGHEVYDFRNPEPNSLGFHWSEVREEYRSWTPTQFAQNLYTHKRCLEGFTLDKQALDWADTCVLLLPCNRSAHLEAGYMIGRHKPTIIMIPDGIEFEPELMYLLAPMIVTTLDALIAAL